MKKYSIFCFILLFLIFMNIQNIYSFRCDGKIVSDGDTMLTVLSKCGKPVFKERFLKEEILEVKNKIDLKEIKYDKKTFNDGGVKYKKQVIPYSIIISRKYHEEWVYNQGSSALLKIVIFENDKLLRVETGGYGYDDSVIPEHGEIEPTEVVISEGDTKFDVLKEYGSPGLKKGEFLVAEIEFVKTEKKEKDKKQRIRITYTKSEIWKYEFGPERLPRTIHFKNDRVFDISTGTNLNFEE